MGLAQKIHSFITKLEISPIQQCQFRIVKTGQFNSFGLSCECQLTSHQLCRGPGSTVHREVGINGPTCQCHEFSLKLQVISHIVSLSSFSCLTIDSKQ